jgi:putative ABC transport system ATP-binding protein
VSSSELVVCSGLSKTYETRTGDIEALHEVDAAFGTGELTAVVGSSGSGKSTLLRAIAGLDRPSGGSLRVRDSELAHASPSTLRGHRRHVVTYVSQKAAENFVPHLTMREQVEASDSVVGLFDDFGLAGRLDSRPIQLSGGEQARAAFALALGRGTPLIVADEPTAELDRESAASLLGAIHRHAEAGVGFVVATHDPDVIAAADRVLRLDRGRVIESEQPRPERRPEPPRAGHETIGVAESVAKSFRRGSDEILAVRDISLELRRGELVALLGRSGSGKSTLLTMLAGWLAPDHGVIRYELGSGAPADLLWRDLALLPQRFGLMPELSVRENVGFPARIAGTGEENVEPLLEQLGLAELGDRSPTETSIGQQQRTALARALVLSPAVLLADEPTSHQDAGWRDAVWLALERAAANGTSCLIATHEDAVVGYATRVLRVSDGVLT